MELDAREGPGGKIVIELKEFLFVATGCRKQGEQSLKSLTLILCMYILMNFADYPLSPPITLPSEFTNP